MNLIDLCIQRPILTWMLTLSLVVFGVLGYRQLGVDQLPNMEFPVVTVTAQLEGAAPEVMEEDVTEVLEEHLNTIGGLRKLSSTTFHGAATIVAEFELERDLDQATQDVRDKVARARRELPKELEPPVVDKINLANRPDRLDPDQLDPPRRRGDRVRPLHDEALHRDDRRRRVHRDLRAAGPRHPHLARRRAPCARATSPRAT